VDGTETRRLLDTDNAAVLTSSGHLPFTRQGTLYAQRFDPIERELVGPAVVLPEQVAVDTTVYRPALTASAVGSIAYRSASSTEQRQFAWFDRSGNVASTVGDPLGGVLSPSLSADQRQVVFSRNENGNQDIWRLDIASGEVTRLTFDTGIDFVPLWSPNGERIVFNSARDGAFDLYEKLASGAGTEQRLLATAQTKYPLDWSPDGRVLLYASNDPQASYDIWALPLDGARTPFAVVQTPFEERDAQFSPDGAWIAYQSNESGRLEIYVQAFPGPGGRAGRSQGRAARKCAGGRTGGSCSFSHSTGRSWPCPFVQPRPKLPSRPARPSRCSARASGAACRRRTASNTWSPRTASDF